MTGYKAPIILPNCKAPNPRPSRGVQTGLDPGGDGEDTDEAIGVPGKEGLTIGRPG